ncbi:histidine kinase [Dyadobacter sandarakinus]|uniref:Type IV pili methyl-accepting chemotaxis transducer N-terminal domain-containing protein n=1 Tax=Dyadobacter sandarakinus TaxID=2747268 RepID=A0ABX7I3E3_9BACT|nr:histidine kinase [Dyadobacter sandarakinus]QRR00587.1 type IV pili methyl-accepting chemotaxis transducer N-terminal domain-containing protein [Dyadobacter sandarakinus]
MERLDKRVAGSLTRFYVVALCVVAMLTISGLFLIRRAINRLNHDSRIVNVAGRQRMLSQRLTKLAVLKTTGIPHRDHADAAALLDQWKNSHQQLASRKLPVGGRLVVWKSQALDSMFAALNPVFDSLFVQLSNAAGDSTPVRDRQLALGHVLDKEQEYLAGMDRIVYQFDRENVGRLENLERIEWILDIMTILVLFAEGLLIFRPVVNTTRRVVRMLTESENALQQSNEKLKETNRQLVVAQNELLRVEEEKYALQLAEDRVRAAALIEGQEEERKRFALELHDGIGQMLTALKLHAEKLKSVQFHEEKHQKQFGRLTALVQDIIQTTRQVSFNLMPSVLSDFGLQAALKLLCGQTAEASGIRIDFAVVADDSVKLERAVETGLYRIAQEALNNAVKHARATHIDMKLHQNHHLLTLEIADNGKGFLISNLNTEPAPPRIHQGIENIRTRTQLLNGHLEIISKVDSGTRLVIRVDL